MDASLDAMLAAEVSRGGGGGLPEVALVAVARAVLSALVELNRHRMCALLDVCL